MHRLEEQIARWRKEIGQADSLSPSDLTELEQHLRDSVAKLTECGLSQDEAFLIASQRLGGCQALAAEYIKVNGNYIWRRRVFWMLAGYIAIRLAAAWIGTLSSVATTVAAYAGTDGTIMGMIAAGVTWVGWLLLLLALWGLAMVGRPVGLNKITQASSTVLAIGIATAISGGVLLATLARIMTARLVSPEIFGQSQIVLSATGLALQLLIPLLCLAMMWTLRRQGYGGSPQQCR